MAIKIPNLQTIADTYNASSNVYTTNPFVYKDLYLDIAQNETLYQGFQNPVFKKDIKVSYDDQAISNSLTNLFNTIPGQRFLFPEYGLNLRQYLFEPISEINAQIIGRNIFDTIKLYETRVTPLNVNVIADPDNNLYIITITVVIPVYNATVSIYYNYDITGQKFINITNNQ
jgi:phage baseplate assembly protein W